MQIKHLARMRSNDYSEVYQSQFNQEDSNLIVIHKRVVDPEEGIAYFNEKAALEALNGNGFQRLLYSNDDTLELILSYIPGLPLEATKIDEEQKIPFILSLVDKLKNVHSANFIHNDLKPSNVIVNVFGTGCLIDFGKACKTSAPQADYGTELYAAPEAYMGSCSEKSDIFSLATITFELLTGMLPFGDLSGQSILNCYNNRLSCQLPQQYIPLAHLLTESLSPDADVRPDIDEFRYHLQRFYSK
ncbi:MAG: serine/threonine protein kinase [Candidatus Woesearchaeota archaeon]